MSSVISLTVIDGEPRVDSRVIAAGFGVAHKNTRELIEQYLTDFKDFGVCPFETAKPSAGSAGGRPEKFYLLNEPQAYLLLTYSQNTEQARGFKKRLVQAFGEQRRALEAAKAQRFMPIVPKRPGLPPFEPINCEQWQIYCNKLEDIVHCSANPDWAWYALTERMHFLFLRKDSPEELTNIPADQWPAVVKELDALWAEGQQHHARMAAAEEDFILNVLRPPKGIAQQRVQARKDAEVLAKRRAAAAAAERTKELKVSFRPAMNNQGTAAQGSLDS